MAEQVFLSGSYDKTIKIWNVYNARMASQINFDVPICDIAISPNKQYFAAAGFNTLKVFNTQTLQQIYQLKPEYQDYCISAVAFDENGQYLAAAGEDGYLQIYETKNLQFKPTIIKESCILNSVEFYKNYLILALQNGHVKVFDSRKSWKMVRDINCFSYDIGVRWATMHGDKIVCGDGRGILQYYCNFELSCSIQAHYDSIMRVRFAPDGQSIFSCSCDKNVKQWRFWDDKLIKYRQIMMAEHTCFDVVGFRDGVLCACDKGPKLFTLEDEQFRQVKQFSGHTGLVTCLAFSE